MKNTIWMAAAVLILMVSGCGDKIPQGKYTEEQMKTIPFPTKENLPKPSGGISLNVESETLSSKELSFQLESQLKPLAEKSTYASFRQVAIPLFMDALRNQITDILLYKQAKKKASENIDEALDKAVESELKRFLASYDNNRALADNALRVRGYDWKTYRDYQKRLILTQSFLSSEFTEKRPVAHSELMDYYTKHRQDQFCWDGTIQFRVIELIPGQMPAELIQANETPETATLRLTLEIMTKIKSGEDFGKLAEQYSQGSLASQAGLWQPITIGADSLKSPYEILEQKALIMDIGQVAGPLAVEGRILIMKLESRKDAGCKEFKDVQDTIEEQFQFEFRKEQYSRVVDTMMSHVDVSQMNEFLEQSVADAFTMWSPKQ